MSTTETPVTSLATIEKLTPPQLFAKGALDPIIAAIEAEVRSFKTDISTVDGRKAVAALAYKVARSKTYVDEAGKSLVADKKEEVKAVDRERSRVWDRLESLQKEVRKPLTDWENAEKERVSNHEKTILELQTLIDRAHGQPLADVQASLEYAESLEITGMQEFTQRALEAKEAAVKELRAYYQHCFRVEQEREELARLRKESAERAEKDRIEAAAKQARDQAEREAKEREEAAERKATEERDQAKREQLRIESEKRLAEDRAAKAEQDRLAFEERTKREMAEADKRAKAAAAEAAKKAEADRAAAAKQAEADTKAAVEAERKRVADLAKEEAARLKALAKDKEHKAAIHEDIIAALALAGYPTANAKALIILIAKGKIPHVSITY